MDNKYTHSYEDIIHLSHPRSTKHPPMSIHDRAAQFSPFAALTGHEDAIEETARRTDFQIELEEDEKERINERLQFMQEHLGEDLEVRITYFLPDEKKAGGRYLSYTGIAKRMNAYEHRIVMRDGTCVPMESIREIEVLRLY